MGPVRLAGLDTDRRHPVPEEILGVDPHVAALGQRGVVLGGQRPADLLGQPGRHGDGDAAAGLEHPVQLGHGPRIILQVLHDLRADDAVERVVGEGKAEGVAPDRLGLVRLGHLAGVPHGPQEIADPGQLIERVVERDDSCALAEGLERVATGATAHIEDDHARSQVEQFVVDGQHRWGFSQLSARRAR